MLCNHFQNIKQETSETFIAALKDKLIKKVCPHAPADLATIIRHAKNYKMTIEEANHTKLTNLQRKLKAILQINNNSSNNHKNIYPYNDTTKTALDHYLTTNPKIVIIIESQNTKNEIVGSYKETNKTGVINIILYHNKLTTNLYYQLIIHQDHKIKTITINWLHNQFSNNISNLYQFSNIKHHPFNNFYIQPSYLTIQKKSDFQQTALSESEVITPRLNSFNNTIPLAQIAQNANLSDIFLFEFKANKLPFLLNNAVINEQKTITAMYIEATQLNRNVNRPVQTVIVTADGMKKTPVREIDNFLFTINGIIILVKVLIMNTPQYQKTQELKISYQRQYIIVSVTYDTFNKQSEKAPVFEFKEKKKMPLTKTYMALGSTSNWAEETEQEIFEESRE
ncbi:hypothetical protein G9A89_015460 [Geosiphon pyriformis]|nr:hypothetical protein G9A89_015460 [Geosiphon pyriformis]